MAEFMPDEVTDSIMAHLRMLPYHARWVRYKVLKRNGRIPPEVSRAIVENLKMLPYHFAYIKGAASEKLARNPPMEREMSKATEDRCWSLEKSGKFMNVATGRFTSSKEKATRFTSSEKKTAKLMFPDCEWVKLEKAGSKQLKKNGIFDVFTAPKSVKGPTLEQVQKQEELIENLLEKMEIRPTLNQVILALQTRRQQVIVPHTKIDSLIDKVFDRKEADVKKMEAALSSRVKRNSSSEVHEHNIAAAEKAYKAYEHNDTFTDELPIKMFALGFKYAQELAAQGEVKADSKRILAAAKKSYNSTYSELHKSRMARMRK